MLLLKIITDRAEHARHSSCFDTSEEWIEHWFKTAAAFRQECQEESLMNTVLEIDALVTQQHHFCAAYNYTGKA